MAARVRSGNMHLDINNSSKQPATSKVSDQELAESWEDEEIEDDNATPTGSPSLKPVTSNDPALRPPPPTPHSATPGGGYDWSAAGVLGGGIPKPLHSSGTASPRSESDSERRRPEKTTAAAGRMIAASLGVKAPKKTEEQRQYDRAMKEQEAKRRSREKEEKERERIEDEKAKAAVWDS